MAEEIAPAPLRDPHGRSLIFLRLLALTGSDENSLQRDLSVQALRRLVLLHLCVQQWFFWQLADIPTVSQQTFLLGAYAYTLSLVVGWWPRWSRAAFCFALAISISQIFNQFPFAANHQYLELGILAFGALFDSRIDGEDQLLLQSCRWLVAAVLFWAGLQKILHGYYFGAEFLSFAISQEPRFAQIFGLLLPTDELIRLQSYGQPADVGAGPYRADSWGLVLVSNSTYVLEIGVAIGLLIRRVRRFALVTGVALILAIEVVAREVFFGAFYIALLTLFARRALNWQLFPIFAAFYVYLFAAAFGFVPAWGAH